MAGFIMLSDGKNVVIKSNKGSYKFKNCYLTDVNIERPMDDIHNWSGIIAKMPGDRINVNINFVTDCAESGDDLDLTDCVKLEDVVNKLDFGKFSRNLDL